jgi:phenylpropionate dioxygenase-like ring-hydroxylating dioxygenase large terminal subunit
MAARRPPSFDEAQNRRQRVRAAGLDPDYWYAVEYDRALPRSRAVQVKFWDTSITLSRAPDGAVRATSRIRSYPVRVRYGLIWLFPGDPARAAARPLPAIPELEGNDPWAYVPLSFTWRAHHSMVIDNLCDLTHAHLHRKYPGFLPGRLLRSRTEGDSVILDYEAKVGPLIHSARARPQPMEIRYDYPYHRARFQWSAIEGDIQYWTFILPVDARTSRVFFVFCYDRLRFPWLPFAFGHRVLTALLWAAHRFVPLLEQDGFALEAEQEGYERGFDAAPVELNPAVALLHQLTIRKWREHLARERTPLLVEA